MSHAATGNLMIPSRSFERGVDTYDIKLGMWVFLASEVMFFGALIGTYIILRFSVEQPWAQPGVVLAVPLTAFNTFLLICSSVSMVKAFAAIAAGDQKNLRFWLLATILGGATFVGVQVFEYVTLVGHGLTPGGYREGSQIAEHALADPVKYGAATAGLYGSTFFTMTGFHGFHVTCGVVSMTYLYFTKALPGKYTAQDYRGIEAVGLYWHFVDLVWIVLFTIVYLV
jgi:heme/copper-type cytochrome/quinol oxidase subunit 3